MYMKLRNLLFGTMIACAFAACSNEDDPIPSVDPTPETGTASLNVAIDTKALRTKAGEEAALTSLTVVVYDNAGKYLASKTNDGTEIAGLISNDEAYFENIPAGTVKIVAYANMAGAGIDYTADMSAMAGKTFALPITADNKIVATNLPMSSGAASVNLVANKTNFYGYTDEEITAAGIEGETNNLGSTPLPLYRNVARVDLMYVDLNVNANKSGEDLIKSGTASFTINEVFIMNAKEKTLFGNTGAPTSANADKTTWGSVEFTGTEADPLKYYGGRWKWATVPTGKDAQDPFAVIPAEASRQLSAYYTGTLSSSPAKKEQTLTNDSYNTATIVMGTAAGTTPIKSFYVFENKNTTVETFATMLVVKGSYSFKSTQKSVSRSEAYYPVKVGVDGLNSEDADTQTENGVYRNRCYQIYLTIAGDGVLDPTTGDKLADLYVKTKVVDWAKVKQSPVVE